MSELTEIQIVPSADPPQPTWQPPIIDKSPPRPAPTEEYSWKTYNSDAQVIYIRDHEHANRVLAALQPKTGPLGFDLEWRPTYAKGQPENPVALIQLANENTILLLQVTAMKEFPSKLAEVLVNPEIVKAGVAIQSDAKKLFHDCNVQLRNCVDLTLFAKTVDNARWAGKYNNPLGLGRLIESYEYKLLSKGKITRSNWEARLSPKQQEYASNDAHAGYILYRRLEAMASLMESTPQSSWYTFSILSGFPCTDAGLPWQAENPNYDPGPMPPPRELTDAQRERIELRKQQKAARANATASSSTQMLGDAISDSIPPSSVGLAPAPAPILIGHTIADSMAPATAFPVSNQSRPHFRDSYESQNNRGYRGRNHWQPSNQRGRPRHHEQHQQPRTNNNAFTNSNDNTPVSFGLRESFVPDNSHVGSSSTHPRAQHRSFQSSANPSYRGSWKRRAEGEATNLPASQNRNARRPYRPHRRGGSFVPPSTPADGPSPNAASSSSGPPPASGRGP